MSVQSRRQALKFCLNSAVVVVIEIGDEFSLEVANRFKILKIEQFTLEMAKEILHDCVIQTVGLSAHALANTFLFEHSLVLLVLVVPTLIGMKNEL